MVRPLFHVARFQKLPNQTDECLVVDAAAQQVSQHMMVKAVEAGFNISFHEPMSSSERILNLSQSGVAAFFGPKTVRTIGKSGFKDAFQHHSDHFLYELIIS